MNRFQRGQAHLVKRFLANAQITVRYHRKDAPTILIDVWPNETLFRVLDKENTRLEWGDRDYIIPVASLKINGILTEPAKTDWIEETFPQPHGIQFFMLSAPETEPIWRWDDLQRTAYRVHTKRFEP